MRTLLTILDSTCRRLVLLAGVAFLLAAGGCSMERNGDEGQPESPLAEYRVSISPSTVVLTAEKPEQNVTLSVTCVPSDGSLTFPIYDPGWSVNNPQPTFVEVKVDQHGQVSTTAKLTITENALFWAGLCSSDTLLDAQSKPQIGFLPKNVPLGFSVTGQRYVTVQLPHMPGPDVRQPTPALKPELTFNPESLPIKASGTSPVTSEVTIVYKGQSTELVSIELSGTDAAKFKLWLPILPRSADTLSAVTVLVTFLGLADANDYNTYHAEITVTTANRTTRTVHVSARQ
jgi:hypothetical protein